MPICRTCEEAKSDEEFAIRSDTGKRRTDCTTCRGKGNLARYHSDPSAKERSRLISRKSAALRKYGMTPEEYEELLCLTGGRCGICLAPPAPRRHHHIDHDHATGRVRGLLCHSCNVALGHFRDNPHLLARAIEYLENTNAPRGGHRDERTSS